MFNKLSKLWRVNLGLGVILAFLVCVTIYKDYASRSCVLSEDEIIKLAIEGTLVEYPQPVSFPNGGGWHKPAYPIFYKDASDFLQQNPNCCQIVSKDKSSAYVILNHNIHFLNTKGERFSERVTTRQRVPACGWRDMNVLKVKGMG